jgi:hypothetical protein
MAPCGCAGVYLKGLIVALELFLALSGRVRSCGFGFFCAAQRKANKRALGIEV